MPLSQRFTQSESMSAFGFLFIIKSNGRTSLVALVGHVRNISILFYKLQNQVHLIVLFSDACTDVMDPEISCNGGEDELQHGSCLQKWATRNGAKPLEIIVSA